MSTVVGVASTQMESYTAIFIDGGSVDLGAQSPARASKSLIGAVFFGAPAAC